MDDDLKQSITSSSQMHVSLSLWTTLGHAEPSPSHRHWPCLLSSMQGVCYENRHVTAFQDTSVGNALRLQFRVWDIPTRRVLPQSEELWRVYTRLKLKRHHHDFSLSRSGTGQFAFDTISTKNLSPNAMDLLQICFIISFCTQASGVNLVNDHHLLKYKSFLVSLVACLVF